MLLEKKMKKILYNERPIFLKISKIPYAFEINTFQIKGDRKLLFEFNIKSFLKNNKIFILVKD